MAEQIHHDPKEMQRISEKYRKQTEQVYKKLGFRVFSSKKKRPEKVRMFPIRQHPPTQVIPNNFWAGL